MGIIAAILPLPVQVQRLRTSLRDRHTLRECQGWPELMELCDREPVRIAVVDLYVDGKANFEGVRMLKQRFPRITLVAYLANSPERGHDLFDAGRAGLDGLVLLNEDDAPRPLLSLVEQSESRSLAGMVRRSLDGIDPAVADAILLAISRAHERLSPIDLARLLALPRRAMLHRLAAAGFPPPQRLLTWGRLILAAHLLEDSHRSADRVAHTLDFPSGSAFRNTCQRYLGATPGEIRAGGGASFVLRGLLEQVGPRGGGDEPDDLSDDLADDASDGTLTGEATAGA